MRILYLGYFDELCASLAAKYYVRRALKKHARVISYGPQGFRWGRGIDVVNLERIYKPDVVLLQGRWVSWKYPKYGGVVPWKNLAKVKAPVAMHFTELKTNLVERINWMKRRNIDMTFWGTHTIMQQHKGRFHKGHKARWLPWSVPTDIFKDYGFKRTYDVAVLGAMMNCYPLRTKARKELSRMNNIQLLTMPRPPRDIRLPSKDAFIHRNYAQAIAHSKILLFDTQEGYAIKKYYEGMASGTLVMATNPYFDAKRLHFKDGVNFVQVGLNNYLQKVQFYLNNDKERRRITNNAVNMIKKHHSSEVRAKQLYNHLKELIKD